MTADFGQGCSLPSAQGERVSVRRNLGAYNFGALCDNYPDIRWCPAALATGVSPAQARGLGPHRTALTADAGTCPSDWLPVRSSFP